MDKICRKCGLPVKVNEEIYDVLENMHWICFHLEFEHGEHDPDEPCDDPSCPWNRISGRNLNIINSHSDIKVMNGECNSGIYINKKDVELEHYPSIEAEVTIHDEYIREYTKLIWITEEEILGFQKELENIWVTGMGEAILKSMSEEDFSMRIANVDSCGHLFVSYKFQNYKYINNRNKAIIAYENAFEINISSIEKILNGIRYINKVFEK
jgi:hypothetical protein